jgi:hypothetical protein
MTDLVVTEAQVDVVFPEQAEVFTAICAEAITAGQSLFRDTAGKVQLADANAAGEQQTRFLALQSGAAGQAIAVLKKGHVYGFTLTSQAFDAPIFQSDTVGVLADSAGTLAVPVGIVDAVALDPATIVKVLYFEPRWRGDYS